MTARQFEDLATEREFVWWQALDNVRAIERLEHRASEGDEKARVELAKLKAKEKQ